MHKNIWYNDAIMLTEFISKKLKKAKYKLLEDGQYFGDIPGIRGVWAVHKNLQACKKELQEVFEEWLILQIADGVKIPGFCYN
jgi:predicted RNase H-like HicB family nuclease